MKPDPVLAELWRIRDELAHTHEYDVIRLGEALLRRQNELKQSGVKYLPPSPRAVSRPACGSAPDDEISSKRAG